MTRLAVRIVAAVTLAIAASGCNPMLTAQSPAPPGRAARLDAVTGFWGIKSYRMELSEGVAIALTCHHGGPCEALTVTSDDPAIAEVRSASLGTLEPSGIGSRATSAAVVVVGKSPGTTRFVLRSKSGGRTIAVTVVPPPPAATASTVAR